MPDPTHLLITGATGGVGATLVRRLRLAHPTALLSLVARDGERLALLAEQVGGPTAVLATDLSTEAGAEALARHLDATPPPEGVAHLVGSLLLKPAHRTSFAEWRACQAANLDSAFLVLRAVSARLAPLKASGSLVFASSVAAGTGFANHEAIGAAKAGIEGLVRSAAATYAAQGLRINAIAPGLTETPLTSGLIAAPAVRTAMNALHPLGRIGTAEDQAAAVAWLLGPESSWITGQVLGIDGGLSRLRGR